MELSLTTPIRYLPRVGPAMATRLSRLGITTVEQLLFHVPFRYDDFSLVSTIAAVQPNETVTIKGRVEKFSAFVTKTGKKMQEAKISDETGTLTVIWFNQIYLRNIIKPGVEIRCSGRIGWFGHTIAMTSPSYEIIDSSHDSSLHTGRLVPVYPETEGVSSKWLRARISFALREVLPTVIDYLPTTLIESEHVMGLADALQTVHFPSSLEQAHEARRRLAFDELLLLQIRAYEEKYTRQKNEKAPHVTVDNQGVEKCISSLPFTLTGDQKRALEDMFSDFAKPYPMNRLLEGDVGSGKTIVAAIAMYATSTSGYQSVLMAPTQILAAQHFDTISRFLSPFHISVDLLTAETSSTSKKRLRFSKSSVVVGTHALLSQKVRFHNLGLVVIDEQHRFGVAQRTKLTEKTPDGIAPHLLTMTATPIPRTVAKTMLGHMELSTLNEMPKGRKRVKTWVVPNTKREAAYEWITKQIGETHGQAFIICPLIEESETLVAVKAVKQEYVRLTSIFPSFSLGLLHGRMKADEKRKVLAKFREGKHEILVATPVVEVGIDIPNATIMVIEASERFGLGQLHQLRGRVGRGELPSYCLLFSDLDDAGSITRLKSMETVYSGPRLAEIDLSLRGPGELLGVRQHGIPNLKIASFSDTNIINDTQDALGRLTQSDPGLASFPLLREKARTCTIEAITQD
jgi:ATP-dependent DNA helicase RecG